MKKLKTNIELQYNKKIMSKCVGVGPCTTKKNNQHGITLIALVITIIVLLILAGVVLNMVMGESGIFGKAQIAKEQTLKSQAQEDVEMRILEAQLKTQTDEHRAATLVDLKIVLGESTESYIIELPASATIVQGADLVVTTSTEYIYVTNTAYNQKIKVYQNLSIDPIITTVAGGTNGGSTTGGGPGTGDDQTGDTPGGPGTDTPTVTIASGDNLTGTEDKTINGQAGTYANPTIPAGFKAVDHSMDSTIDENADWTSPTGYQHGLVIQDSSGNQYVWIPVDGTNVILNRYNYSTYSEQTDWSTWITKVGEHGGYYIGRYETSYNSNTSKFESKGGTNTPKVSVTKAYARSYAQGMDTSYGYTTVTTDLLNSYMWDTAIKFIEAYSGTSDFGTNSGGLGNRNTTGAVACGSSSTDIKCNIADMAGNVREWTTEYYSSVDPCVPRGGHYGNSFSAGYRNSNGTGVSNAYIGFRSALYW